MPTFSHPGYRVFVLGAGFSRPAGLPLATELYARVRSAIAIWYGADTKFARDVRNYIVYAKSCGLSSQTEENLDLESFMSYLDIEHYLGLRGSDTWSFEGNESQLMIRKAIGQVIHSMTPPADRLPDIYLRFAENLKPHDIVLSFNYDLVLERALEAVGKRYRRYPTRYSSVGRHGGVVDSSIDEVILFKLHGSVDWFDNRQFLQLREGLEQQGVRGTRFHDVFDDPRRYGTHPLVDGLTLPGDKIQHVHWIEKVTEYYDRVRSLNAPFILSPSHLKFVYSEPIASFWRGLGQTGGYNLGMSVVGFSLPAHDEYIRVALFQMLSNYGSWWNQCMLEVLKDYARFVDYRSTQQQVDEYRTRYRFADPDRSRFHFGGFGSEAIDFLFNQHRDE